MKPRLAWVITFCLIIFLAVPIMVFGQKDSIEKNPVVLLKTSLGDIQLELFAKDAPLTVANFIGLAEGTRAFTDPASKKQVKQPFYDNLIFHRVIKGFMIQGGCPLGSGQGGPGYKFGDEIDAKGLGLDKLIAVDPVKGPHPYLGIRSKADFQRAILAPLFKSLNIKSQEELDKSKNELEAKMKTLTVQEAFENMGYKYSVKGSSHPLKRGVLAMANAGPNTNGSQFFINLADTPWLSGKHTVFGKVIKGMDVLDKIGQGEVGKGSKPLKDVKIISIRKLQKK